MVGRIDWIYRNETQNTGQLQFEINHIEMNYSGAYYSSHIDGAIHKKPKHQLNLILNSNYFLHLDFFEVASEKWEREPIERPYNYIQIYL